MRTWLAAVTLMCVLLLRTTTAAAAQTVELCTLVGERQFQSVLAWLLTCPATGRALDVYVVGVARAEDVFKRESGTWLVDATGRGAASIVVTFERNATGLTAAIFHDLDGDRAVATVAEGGRVRVTESRYPSVTVRSRSGTWQRDGQISFDLDLSVDGPIPALFGADGGFGLQTHRAYQIDGVADTTIEIHPGRTGRAGVDLRQGYFGVPATSGVPRSQLMVDEDATPGVLRPGSILHYIGDVQYGMVLPHGQRLPPIQVDWELGLVTYIGEFVPSRSTDSGWFVYSLTRIDGANPVGDFENPFAFYDLADARDGYPDLAIRQEYFPPGDPYFDSGRSRISNQVIRYSWDQNHDHRWDYKLDLVGRHALRSTVRVGSTSLLTVPYNDFPQWVAERPWDIIGFVAHEPGTFTSEGMYESQLDMLTLRDEYVTGKVATPPPAGDSLPQGFRSEFSLDTGAPARLYVSSVDRQLHLLGAQTGSMARGGAREVRYGNLGGPYVNTWQVVEGGAVTTTLLAAAGNLVLADASGIWVKPMIDPPALYVTPPPGTSDELTRLGEALRAQGGSPPPDDLRAMFDRQGGVATGVFGGALLSHRLTQQGLHLVFEVRTPLGEPPIGRETAPWATHLVEGLFAAVLDGRRATVAPGEAPRLQILDLMTVVETGRAMDPVLVTARLNSGGGQDPTQVTVTMNAMRDGFEPVRIGEAAPIVVSGQDVFVHLAWTPAAAGDWQIEAVAVWNGGAGQTSARSSLSIAPAEASGLASLAAAQGISPLVAVGLVVTFLTACAIAGWLGRSALI